MLNCLSNHLLSNWFDILRARTSIFSWFLSQIKFSPHDAFSCEGFFILYLWAVKSISLLLREQQNLSWALKVVIRKCAKFTVSHWNTVAIIFSLMRWLCCWPNMKQSCVRITLDQNLELRFLENFFWNCCRTDSFLGGSRFDRILSWEQPQAVHLPFMFWKASDVRFVAVIPAGP